MDKNQRLGLIVKIIANHPGITMVGLLAVLHKQKVDITERTLAKDILSLKSDYGLLPDSGRLRKGYFLSDICTLSVQEVALVINAMHVFGTRLSDPEAQRMLERLAVYADVQPTRTIGHRNIYKKTKNTDVEPLLLLAMRSHSAVSMTYLTPRVGRSEKVEGYPLLMVFHERGWYCIVRDIQRKHYHPRRLDRIQECALSKNAATNNQHGEDLRECQFLMSAGWGMSFPRSAAEMREGDSNPEIVVRFDRTVAGYILEAAQRHPRGRAALAKDGTGDALFKIKLSNSKEFQHWVRSFGASAQIIAPPQLVEDEKNEIRRMAIKYAVLS